MKPDAGISRMDRRPRTATGSNTATGDQLGRLCRHILGPGASEAEVNARYKSAVKVLSSMPSVQDDVTVNEFSAVEKIKRYLVRDGRETEVAKFTDLYLCLRNSAMVSNRDAILTLFLHLTEKSARPGHPKRVPPPFTLIHPGGSLLANEKRQPPTSLINKSVISIGSGDVIYHNRATQPGSRARSGNGVPNGNAVSPTSSAMAKSPGFYPPIAPKPVHVSRSPSVETLVTTTATINIGPRTPERDSKREYKTDMVDSRAVGASSSVLSVVNQDLEQRLIRELIYAFQGIEGVIIKWKPGGAGGGHHRSTVMVGGPSASAASVGLESEDLPFDDRSGFVIGPQFVNSFPPPVINFALRMAELGWLYTKVSAFCDKKAAESELGLVGQSLITGLRNELTEYYRLLSVLEAQLKKDDDEQQSSGGRNSNPGLTLHQLAVCTMEPMERMKLLANIVRSCGRLRGGALISVIYGFLHHGSPETSATVKSLLTTVCRPLYNMILKWIFDGVLEDPFTEFFIASDAKLNDEAKLWHDKYSVRRSMIPKFMALSLSKKILATGKNINFLRSVCKDDSCIPGRESVMTSLMGMSADLLFSDSCGNRLHEAIEHCYRETSRLVLDTMFHRYKLIEHVSAMRKYLLLGQGDLIRYLLELLDDQLCQPASNLYPHTLAGILESAIRATNTQFEDPDILERLDVRLLDVQPGDTGWDVFSLDYKVGGPIGTVFGQKALTNYLMLFNALWRGKRMEWVLSCVWTRGTGLHRLGRPGGVLPTDLGQVLHAAHLLASEMVHFVHQLAYYTTFEVMECSWDMLVKQLKSAENLDEVIEAHNEFVATLIKRAFLDERSRDLLTQLRAIYDRILEFSAIQNDLYSAATDEAEARAAYNAAIEARSKAGRFGITQADEHKEKRRRQEFSKAVLPNIETKLKIVSQSYQDMVRTFLLQLACSQDQSLQFLSIRLDFNEHYKRKDSRLGAPLTFQHKRLSILA